ncbi:isochorismate synthase [Symbiopectobacterium purcellii]|uniref:isochorismate synthase n=1 Tax=Symbiopectobacterium purcellii TaxID=2871826 RepID=A0ABX9AL08_9ENTR|nr:isochorismate synthase [Symbiopectobacterium purcellii]QZN94395.1 isochorismate synthase [Symbiopectobacterium purcellii]
MLDAIVTQTSNPSETPVDFSYYSTHRCVSASGIFERISQPAQTDGDNGQSLWQKIQATMARARAQGVSAPLVVGAIPFDTCRPSCLFIPLHYHFTFRQADTSLALSNSASPIATITQVNSMPDVRHFQSAVGAALRCVRQGEIRKVVLSRLLDVDVAQPIDCSAVMNNLRAQNPHAYHFSLPLPEGGILVGASPELLIRKNARRIWSNPLAGSICRHQDPQHDKLQCQQLLDSHKDQQEHRMVVDDIARHLRPLCRQLITPSAPSLLATNTMWHLSSPIEGELYQTDNSVIQLACLLHPTPAMCGTPTAAARQLIAELEPYDRGLFSGIVGWSDEHGDGEWAIIIRSAIIRQQQVRFFAGAGIVEGSDGQKEWEEIAGKMGTMLRALGLQLPG